MRFFAVATVYFSYNTSLTTLFGQIGQTSDNCLLISEKNVHVQFQQTICGRSVVEPATSGSAVRLALDARDSAARYTWAAAWQSQQNGHWAQRRHRSACASAQSDQSLRCPQKQTLGPQLSNERTTKTLIRNKPHFWRLCSLSLCMQSQWSLVRAPALPHTGYTCNLHRISHFWGHKWR